MDRSINGAASRERAGHGGRLTTRERGQQIRDKKGSSTKSRKDQPNSKSDNIGTGKGVKPFKSTIGQLVTTTPAVNSGNEAEICIICASDIVHEGLGPCNHRTCHVCSIRMRVLFKDQTCTLCRTPASYLIITDNRTKPFEEYNDEYFKEMNFKSVEDRLGLRFDSIQAMHDSMWMLDYNCPDKDCDVACPTWPLLHDHTRKEHGKKICDLCSRHRKIFAHEHDLFTDAQLSKHMKEGDHNPGETNQSGFKGHPLCVFCRNRFYGDDELFNHLREKHERCFVCDRANPNSSPSYYIDYNALRIHFVKDHFLCQVKDCLDQKYIAFVSDFELKAHMLEMHGNELSKDVRRDTRNVDLSGFSYRQPYLQERRAEGSRREQSDSTRNRREINRDIEPITPSSHPLRRDEQAFQRNLTVHSAQSNNRNLGSQLTPSAPTQTRSLQSQVSQPSGLSTSINAITDDTLNLNLAQPNISPRERARALRHAAVIERASILLQRDTSKLSRFRMRISMFKNGSITAQDLIDYFFMLFENTSSSALGTLIREVADVYEDPNKANELRTAWNNWRAINEDYPSLPSTSSKDDSTALLSWAARNGNAASSSSGTIPSNRVINLKKSTSQSRYSSVSNSRSWGSATLASGSVDENSSVGASHNSTAFPRLPSSCAHQNKSNSSKIVTVPWTAASSSGSVSTAGDSRSLPNRRLANTASSGTSSSPSISKETFPALPSSSKPQRRIVGYSGTVGVPKDNVWGGSGQPSPNSDDIKSVADVDGSSKGKKKGGKGKKQILMGWG